MSSVPIKSVNLAHVRQFANKFLLFELIFISKKNNKKENLRHLKKKMFKASKIGKPVFVKRKFYFVLFIFSFQKNQRRHFPGAGSKNVFKYKICPF